MRVTRRAFLQTAWALHATGAWSRTAGSASRVAWRERRDLYPEGVASGDPDFHSVLLWTRRNNGGERIVEQLDVEVAEDPLFKSVVAVTQAPISAAADWTCRVMVGGLKPSTEYWYRFTDFEGNGSRVGRTITAPAEQDGRPIRFVFVSCQNANQGAQNSVSPHDL